jgi:basic membrane protein A
MWGQVTDPKVKAVILNSVTKGVGASVAAVITDTVKGKFSNVQYVGTLANKGTGLAGFHDLAKKVPAKLQQELRALASSISAGAVDVTK